MRYEFNLQTGERTEYPDDIPEAVIQLPLLQVESEENLTVSVVLDTTNNVQP